MNEIDISILKEPPSLTEKIILEIEPLAPLSMVSDLPGSFYKSLKSPSKKMLCGLFENLLGWHIDIADRTLIQKEIIKVRKKQKIEYLNSQHGSTYIPLLMDYFEVGLVTIPDFFSFNDLWSKAYRRSDTVKHLGGTRFSDGFFIQKWNRWKQSLALDEKRTEKQKSLLLDNLFKRYIGNFAKYYSSPTNKEYVLLKDKLVLVINIDPILYKQLADKLSTENYAYVGNSEGWVNIKIKNYA